MYIFLLACILAKIFLSEIYQSPTVEEHIFFKETVLQRAIKLALSTARVFTLYRIISSVFYFPHVNCKMRKVVFFPHKTSPKYVI